MPFNSLMVAASPEQLSSRLVPNRSMMVVNTDPTNSVWIGEDRSIVPGGPGTIEVSGLGSFVLTPRDMWAVSAGPSVKLQFVPEGSAWTPAPSDITQNLIGSSLASVIASAIQSAGVPPIDNPALVDVVLNQPIAAGASWSTAELDVSRFQSFVGIIRVASTGSTGTTPFTHVLMNWGLQQDNYDPLSSFDWVVPNSPFSFNFNYPNRMHGPCYGDHVQFTFTNYDTQPVQVILGLFGSYRTRSRIVMRGQYNFNSNGTLNESAGLSTDSILLSFGGSIANGTSVSKLINLYNGPVSVSFQSGTNAGDGIFEILPEPQSIVGGAGNSEYKFVVPDHDAAGTTVQIPITETIALPRRVCTLKITNNDTAPHTMQALIVAQEGPE